MNKRPFKTVKSLFEIYLEEHVRASTFGAIEKIKELLNYYCIINSPTINHKTSL